MSEAAKLTQAAAVPTPAGLPAAAPAIAAGSASAAWQAALAFILALGALPSIIFGLLVAAGELKPLPALLGWGVCITVAVGFGILLGRDIAVMRALVWALRTNPETVPRPKSLFVPGMRSVGQEAINLFRAERVSRAALMERSASDHTLLERLPDPLFRLNRDRAITWRNASAVAAFGAETAVLLRHPDVRTALAAARTGLSPVRKSISLAVPVPRDLDATVIPVGDAIYLLITDRTRERSIEKMRADFVANSSHELRTPLASLIGFIETLQGAAADDPEAQTRFLGIMAEQAERMQRVIADLLSLSRIEIIEHQPPADIIALPPVLARIVAGLEPILAATQTEILCDIPDSLPAIPGDPDQLTQVFSNLLDNAIKYGKRGGLIRLTAGPAGRDSRFEPGGIIVAVADDGAGIAREHLPRLTERFYRVDKGRSRAVGGTGLGLAIVKHAINRHRGRLLIESTEGVGTTFTVWLPVRAGG
jgi:two-component system phosphate regulon sensor histidine kinase PhoR